MRNRTLKHLVLLLPALIALFVLASAGTAAAEEPGRIVGSVSAEGFSIGGVTVCSVGYEGAVINKTTCVEDGSTGFYIIPNLAPGKYLVYFEPGAQNYVAQYWDHALDYTDGTPVTVGTGPVYGIDADLEKGATISGTVTAATTGAPIQGVEACADNEEDERCGFTDAAGKYTIPGLFEEKWHVRFFPYRSGQNFLFQDYPNLVQVHTKGAVTGIDAALAAGGQIGGTVTLAATGAPLAGVRVCLLTASQVDTYDCQKTSTSGAYDFTRIETGSWKIAFSPETSELLQQHPYQAEIEELTEAPDAYPTEWWNGKPSFATAGSIAVTPPQIVTGIDGSLGPAAATSGPTPAPTAPTATPTPIPPKPILKCRKGFAKRKVKGKLRCVKRHHKKHHHRRHHKRPAR